MIETPTLFENAVLLLLSEDRLVRARATELVGFVLKRPELCVYLLKSTSLMDLHDILIHPLLLNRKNEIIYEGIYLLGSFSNREVDILLDDEFIHLLNITLELGYHLFGLDSNRLNLFQFIYYKYQSSGTPLNIKGQGKGIHDLHSIFFFSLKQNSPDKPGSS